MATAYRIDDTAAADPARAELAQRIAQLARDHNLLSVGELSRRADALRVQARLNGYAPLARLAAGLADALAAHGRAATVTAYVELMDDALAAQGAADGEALLAAASVRLA